MVVNPLQEKGMETRMFWTLMNFATVSVDTKIHGGRHTAIDVELRLFIRSRFRPHHNLLGFDAQLALKYFEYNAWIPLIKETTELKKLTRVSLLGTAIVFVETIE